MTGARLLIVIAMAIATMCAALMFATHDPSYVIRWTARTSLVLFALAYVARPATVLWPSPLTKRLLRERKWLGDGFAVSHLAHLAAIVAVVVPDWSAFAATIDAAIVIATVMFIVLFAMAITSIDRVRKAMSKRAWNALHRTGMHMAWVVFTTTYAGRLAAHPVWALPVALLAGIASIRLAAWLRSRSRARARVSVAA
ncbi:MAG TPA: ferric reductase-like transmembrane domain-containing protein [Kofleriaceae bacterium]